jgi:predicted Fe-S protein YdhL (DUF1289 family)
MEAVTSPCTGICTLSAKDICLGCGRTLDEIAEWLGASEARKSAIAEAAAQRTRARPSLNTA